MHHSLSKEGSFHKDSCEINRMILTHVLKAAHTLCKCIHSWIKIKIGGAQRNWPKNKFPPMTIKIDRMLVIVCVMNILSFQRKKLT